MLRVCHVSPTYFAAESILGGGERFAEELARAMATRARVKFISFGPRQLREQSGPDFQRVILRNWTGQPMVPFSPRLFAELRGADVIHCHQYFVLPTFLAALWGHLQGSRVFVSDLGGGAWTPGFHIDQGRWITGLLPISAYAASLRANTTKPCRIIYGGVDLARYPMRQRLSHDGSVVFLGRILPHKGIHHLVAGLPPGVTLHVIGTVADPAYRDRLRALAAGKPVIFHSGLADEEVLAHLQRAMALAHPTPVNDEGAAGAHELFGLALVEAMACGCPVVASRVASLPEIVGDGQTGLLVPPNDPSALAAAIERLMADPKSWRRYSSAARRRVETLFTWDLVASRCLSAYHNVGAPTAEGNRSSNKGQMDSDQGAA
jgi:alpha-maltose-1-phosphate synthase